MKAQTKPPHPQSAPGVNFVAQPPGAAGGAVCSSDPGTAIALPGILARVGGVAQRAVSGGSRTACRSAGVTRMPARRARSACAVLPRVVAALGVLVALTACSPPAPPTAVQPAGEWLEFEGNWNASGTRRSLPLGGERQASLLNLQGTLLLTGAARPAAGFRADFIAFNDSATGLVGRAVWTDERGDQVFSELHGEGTATRNRITGKIFDGTGRYAGAQGSYEFSWQYFINADEGVIQGRAEKMQGRVRLGGPGATAGDARSASPAADKAPAAAASTGVRP